MKNNNQENEPPKFPPNIIIREGGGSFCKECGSSTIRKHRWFGKILGCIQSECGNYYKNKPSVSTG